MKRASSVSASTSCHYSSNDRSLAAAEIGYSCENDPIYQS